MFSFVGDSGLPLVFIGLGGNIAPRKKYISSALEILKKRFPGNFTVSSLYLAKPYGNIEQPYFYNCCSKFESDLTPFKLLEFLSATETRIGRKRDVRKWRPRVVDLDIIFFGKELVNLPELTIPHYDLRNRDFFLLPLIELEPSIINPKTDQPLTVELKKTPDSLRTYPAFLQKLETS